MICKPEASRKNSTLDKIRIYFPGRIRLIKEDSTLMRHLLFRSLAALACFGVFSLPQTSAVPKPDQSDKPDFNGTWALDLKASTSVEPLMKQIGANLFEQKYA